MRGGGRRARAVIDTGILVSAFAFGGLPGVAVREVVRKTDFYVSPNLLSEYRAVPRELLARRKVTTPQWRALVSGIAAFVSGAHLVVPRERLAICRDPDDDMVLECCAAANADVLLTGDRDLLDIDLRALPAGGLGRLRIVRPRTFLRGSW